MLAQGYVCETSPLGNVYYLPDGVTVTGDISINYMEYPWITCFEDNLSVLPLPIALMATSFVKNGFGIRFLPLTCMKCDLFIQVQISNSLQHWILGMVNLDIIHKCLVSCLRFCV